MSKDKICVSKQSIVVFLIGILAIGFVLYTNNASTSQKRVLESKADAVPIWTLGLTQKNKNPYIRANRLPATGDIAIGYVDDNGNTGVEVLKVDKDDSGFSGYLINPVNKKKFNFYDKNVSQLNMKVTNAMRMKWGVTGERMPGDFSPWVLKALPGSFEEKYGFFPTAQYYVYDQIACANNQNLIAYYGGGKTDRAQMRDHIVGNTESYAWAGLTIRTQKTLKSKFQAVENEISKYKKSGATYNFPSGTYTLKDYGSYGFRCNANSNPYCEDATTCSCMLSNHAFGIAIDLNGDTAPWGQEKSKINVPSELVAAFENNGFRWGGRFDYLNAKMDPMHFEYLANVCSK